MYKKPARLKVLVFVLKIVCLVGGGFLLGSNVYKLEVTHFVSMIMLMAGGYLLALENHILNKRSNQ